VKGFGVRSQKLGIAATTAPDDFGHGRGVSQHWGRHAHQSVARLQRLQQYFEAMSTAGGSAPFGDASTQVGQRWAGQGHGAEKTGASGCGKARAIRAPRLERWEVAMLQKQQV